MPNYQLANGTVYYLRDACTNCGAELADVLTTRATFDANGNAYCSAKCRREAAALLAVEHEAQPAEAA